MDRRSALKLLGVGGLVGFGGCLGPSSKPTGTEPLTDTFDENRTPRYWNHSLSGTVSLATADGLFALSEHREEENNLTLYRSTVSRIGRNGADVWSRNLDAPAQGLRATDDTVYLFRSDDATTSFRWGDPRLEARETTTGDHRWDQPVDHYSNFVGANTDAVFVGATSHTPGRLPVRAFDTDSGQSRWTTKTPMPRGGTVSHGLCLVHGYPDEVIALDVETGEKHWQKSLSDIDEMAVIGDTLVVLTGGGAKAYALPSGSRRWEWGGEMESLFVADSDSGREVTLYLGETDGTVSALEPETGEVLWSRTLTVDGESESVPDIALAGDTVVVWTWWTLHGLDAASGTERWRQVFTPSDSVAGPVTIDRTVFVAHAPTDDEFAVKTFDGGSGQKQWRFQRPRSESLLSRGTAFAGRFVVASGGELYGFSP